MHYLGGSIFNLEINLTVYIRHGEVYHWKYGVGEQSGISVSRMLFRNPS